MKKGFAILFAVFMLLSSGIAAQAKEVKPVTPSIQSDNGEMILRADQIQTKYCIMNGKLYYRRWNATQGYWVDPDWILA